MALRAYKPGELFRRPMLARLNQKDEEESNISLEAGIDHSGEIVLVKGEGLDLKDSPHGVSHLNMPNAVVKRTRDGQYHPLRKTKQSARWSDQSRSTV